MYSERSLLRRITHQLIYVIVVAALVALSLNMFSQEGIQQTDYHNYNMTDEMQGLHVTEVNSTLNFNKVGIKKLRNDN